MTDKKLNELTNASTLTGTELVYVVQSGADRQTTTQAIANLGGGGGTWGSITGTLSDQTDLQTALNAKANLSGATFTGDISTGANKVTAADVRANSSAGGKLTANGGAECLHFGSGGSANATAYGGWNFDGATANTIASFGASKTLTSLATSTYPSLTELAYVKGVTSAIQTQLDGKQPTGSYLTANQTITLSGDVTGSGSTAITATIASGAVTTSKLGGDITTAGKALLDDVDAAAQRTTLGLGTLATQNGTFSGTSSGTNTGDQTSIVGITGTKAQFDTACTDGNFVYVGDSIAWSTITGAPTTLSGYGITNAQIGMQFQDEGTGLGSSGTVTTINFTGSGVTASRSTDTITVNVAGGGGSSAFADLTAGTNTTAAMVVGTGASLAASGSGTIAATSAATLATPRTIGGVSFNGSADIVPQTIQSINEAADTTCFPLFISASGTQSLQPLNNASFTFNASNAHLGVGAVNLTSATAPTNGAYLVAANTIGWAISGTGEMRLTSAALSPNTNDGNALGTTALQWADLFLASGAVINFANGNVVMTHSTGILTVGTGDLRVTTAGTNAASVVTLAGTQTLTNKRITPRVSSTASSATPTPNADTTDIFILTALAANATFAAPTGTPTDGQAMVLRVKDNGTARTLAYNAIYRALGVTLPTTTVISKTLYMTMIYNAADVRWDILSIGQEA